MIKKFALLLSMSICFSSHCQVIKVKKETARINGENINGVAVDLDGTAQEANALFMKHLKTYGKTKQIGDYIAVSESTIIGKSKTTPIYGLLKDKGKAIQAWLGIKPKELPAGDSADVYQQLEKVIYDFGVLFYRHKAQLQIDETAQALQAVEKQQQRFLNQNRDLNTKLEDNKREKIQLEKSLVNNGLEYEMLLKRIEKNKKDQDSMAIANQQIKKILELQKEKQSKIN